MCPKCSKDLLIDHVDSEGKYVYVCMNPLCENYRKAFYLTEDKPAENRISGTTPDK